MTRWSAAALAAVLALAGCGGDDEDDKAKPVGYEYGGSVAQVADCGDWAEGTEEERRATVVELRRQLTSENEGKVGVSALEDDRAFELFENTCRHPRYETLRLYKLYVRAQAFAPLEVE